MEIILDQKKDSEQMAIILSREQFNHLFYLINTFVWNTLPPDMENACIGLREAMYKELGAEDSENMFEAALAWAQKQCPRITVQKLIRMY